MIITYVKQKKCSSLLKKSIIKMYSSAPESNCMDMVKRKIKNKVIATVKGELKKMILRKMKQY